MNTMSLPAAKLTIVQKILAAEQESFLQRINDMLDNEMIAGYAFEGEPLTKNACTTRLAIAEMQLRNRETISQENLEKESEDW